MTAAKQPGTSAPPPIGVYVHFPWCLKKCPYCDFPSRPSDRDGIPSRRYADAVIAELVRRARELGPRRLVSAYFGGGTPSLWEAAELGRVLGAIRRAFPLGADVEVTVECNPSSFDADHARALLDTGVNRVSVGVQSLSAERLAFLGRLHGVEDGLRAVRDALAAGVPRVSADLIFGVHGQSADDAAREAATLAELGVGHLSAYALTIERATPFGALAEQHRLPLCSDDVQADSFLAVDQALDARGFEHYEISSYARDGQRSQHNLGYWSGAEYLGLGAGAWGTTTCAGTRRRYRNTPSPERYLAALDAQDSGAALECEVEQLAPETALSERILLGLRTLEGVDLEAAGRELALEPWSDARRRAVERLAARGRLEERAGRLRIPKPAWLFADATIAELI